MYSDRSPRCLPPNQSITSSIVLLQYIDVSPEFAESKQHRPNVIQQVQYAFKRLSTLASKPPSKPEQAKAE